MTTHDTAKLVLASRAFQRRDRIGREIASVLDMPTPTAVGPLSLFLYQADRIARIKSVDGNDGGGDNDDFFDVVTTAQKFASSSTHVLGGTSRDRSTTRLREDERIWRRTVEWFRVEWSAHEARKRKLIRALNVPTPPVVVV